MPWFIPALAATATVALARKLVARYWHGMHGQHAPADPDGIRTVARFRTADIDHVMLALAASIGRDIEGLEVVEDAIRARDDEGTTVDVVRVARRADDVWSVELTRAWTGVYLGDQARLLLHRIDVALRSTAHDVDWFARQDRELAAPHATPFDEQAIAAR